VADRTGIARLVKPAKALALAVPVIVAAAFTACAPAASPVRSPPGDTAPDGGAAPQDGDEAHDGGVTALTGVGPESAAMANLPPLPAPPARITVQPLVADETPTSFCPLGIVAPSPAAPPPTTKGHKKQRSEHEPRPFHAAPRIMIDVDGAAETPALAEMQRTVRAKGYWAVRHCYESGLRRDQRLRGSVAVALSVDPSGAVTAAAAAPAPAKGSPLADPVAAACIVREVALLSFDGPQSAAARGASDAGAAGPAEAVQARIDVTLGTGDAPVFAAAPVPNAEAVREALRQSWPDATRCYAHALESNPRAGGRMDLHFRVAKDGHVTSVQEGDVHLAAADLAACVLDVYRRATLPVAPRLRETAPDTALVYGLELEPDPKPDAAN
jgi:hypothetical protein